MMASHRPADAPPPPPPDPETPESVPTPPAPTGLTTLPASNFLIGLDWVLAFGVLALAFLIASFSVKNSDFWMHLATGRLLAEGNYEFGKDPFSYAGTDRTWVNHAWLFDWLLYLLFKAGGGAGVVIAKAIGLAATAGLLLLARKPGQSVFPGVVCVGLALVAAAPRLFLQPTCASFLFLAALMFLLVRVPRRPGSWQFPVLIAGLFWLWANCDQWFFLGPCALLLYTVGQYLRPDEGEHLPTLWKAVGIGVLATVLTPHHVRVWLVLPAELVDGRLAEAFAKDSEFAALFRTAMNPGALDLSTDRDDLVNRYALVGLIVLTVVGFAVNYRKASAGLALVLAGAVILALMHLRAVPFLAFVAAPVAAVNLAAAGRRLADTPLPDGTIRTLHALRGGGRMAVGLVGLLLIVLTYPGWLHPFEQQRRWSWDLEPNASLERAAKKIHEWRTAGTLPPEARLLNLQPDFASYVAWYAPGEKTFFDHRIGFHRDEAAEYAALRRYLSYGDQRKRKQDPFDLNEFLTRYGITFAVYAPLRLDSRTMLASLWQGEETAGNPNWVLWDVQGRAVMLGWPRQRTIPSAAFDRLRFDPLRLAYADAQPLPGPTDLHSPPLTTTDIWERFLIPPPPTPVDAEEAAILSIYADTLVNRITSRHQGTLQAIRIHLAANSRLMTPALYLFGEIVVEPSNGFIPAKFPPEATAVAILAVRAARRAILASPDHPDGYYFLALAYGNLGFDSVSGLKDLVAFANLARARARIPNDPTQQRTAFDVVDLCRRLLGAHDRFANPQQLDLAADALRQLITYLRYDVQERETRLATLPADAREGPTADLAERRRYLDLLEKDLTVREPVLKKKMDQFVVAAAAQVAPLNRAALARRFGLVHEAVAELRKAQEEFQKQLGEHGEQDLPPAELAAHLAEHAELIELLWYDGQAEEASRLLDTMYTPDGLRLMDKPAVRQAYYQVRQQAFSLMFPDPQRRPPPSQYDNDPAGHFRNLRRPLAMILGEFQQAIDVQTSEAQLVRTVLTEFRARRFAAGIPNPADLPTPAVLMKEQNEMFARPMLFHITHARLIQAQDFNRLQQVSKKQADGQVALALTYLEMGEIQRAIHHFRQADDAPGWPEPLPMQKLARSYLAAIERANRGKGNGP